MVKKNIESNAFSMYMYRTGPRHTEAKGKPVSSPPFHARKLTGYEYPSYFSTGFKQIQQLGAAD